MSSTDGPAVPADDEQASSLDNPAVRARIRRVLPWTLVLAAGIILLDQGTKFWAEAELELGVGVPVIGELIQWRLVYNPGAAFGIGGDYTWILSVVAAIAVVGLAIFVTRLSSVRWAIAVGALFGGAISHLGDRLFREPGFARGEIVDFIDYAGYFVGNVADIALVLGAVAVVILSLAGVNPRRPEPREPDPSHG
ncbi:signal peptidase II [Microcella alkalica]|uniref:Lipoprotein signal peptidase n=1 Tax=Microcella alkalica TaxID=355930 RepID=A0A839E6A1_9MICO|nr:signal peptidase II [Microcella alkalica]MBA8847941.1 signal peptidase II [Microcella alkalica]